MRGDGKSASSEKAQLNAAAVQNYQVQIDGAVLRLKTVGGCTDAQISYETPSGTNSNVNAPSDKRCHVFHPAGGGAAWQDLGLGAGCPLTSLSVGQVCNGVVYAGDSGGSRIYTTTSDLGTYTWNNGLSGHGVGWFSNNSVSNTDGLANTNNLIATTDGGSPYAAANACRTLGAEWYLPALNEGVLLMTNKAVGALNGTFNLGASVWYWTSTQSDNSRAKYIRFQNNGQSESQKESSRLVRCVRRD